MMPENSQKENDLIALKNAVRGQTSHTPPTLVRLQLMAKISPDQQTRPAFRWAVGAVLGMVIFGLLWGVVQPGIVLQWVWKNLDVETFQVYRASKGNDNFTLVSEIPTNKASSKYKFVDSKLLPGQTYTYKIQAVTSEGELAFSEFVTDSAVPALPGQLALIMTSLMLAYGLVHLQSLHLLGKLRFV
jgi:hypothetical protein